MAVRSGGGGGCACVVPAGAELGWAASRPRWRALNGPDEVPGAVKVLYPAGCMYPREVLVPHGQVPGLLEPHVPRVEPLCSTDEPWVSSAAPHEPSVVILAFRK